MEGIRDFWYNIQTKKDEFKETGISWLPEFNASAYSASPREENECVGDITRGAAEISGER